MIMVGIAIVTAWLGAFDATPQLPDQRTSCARYRTRSLFLSGGHWIDGWVGMAGR